VNYLTVDELIKDPSDLTGLGGPEERTYELPLKLRIALGTFAAGKKPVPPVWALKWALLDPNIACRTAVFRCAEEFRRVFINHYSDEFGEGMLLPQNKTTLQLTYQAASSAFLGTQLRRSLGEIPDIAAVTGPHKKLQKVVDACTADLDRYSRFVGRNPGKAGSIEAAALLPTNAWPPSLLETLQKIKTDLSTGFLTISFKDFLARLDGAVPAQLGHERLTKLACKFEKMGIGIEPNLATGAKAATYDEPVVLFALNGKNGTIIPSARYSTALLMLDLASTVALADAAASDSEIRFLGTLIGSWDQLEEGQRRRLHAHLQLRMVRPAVLHGLKSRVQGLSDETRRAIGHTLAQVAHADGAVSPEQVKLLERIYKLLQLDSKLLYSDLHRGPTGETVATTSTKVGKDFILDKDQLARLQHETDAISTVLDHVFADESDRASAGVADPPGVQRPDTLLGLDGEHSSFLRLLLSRSQWSRRELTDAASDMELMLDGALERINDAAFDKLGGQITEGEDPVEVNRDILEKVIA
jgi:uncharacterized tellurite resistance protein B-like protein